MTSHSNVTRDYPVTSRVSHATHTTPHHTLSLAGHVCGWSVAKKSSIATAVEAALTDAWMAADAAIGGTR